MEYEFAFYNQNKKEGTINVGGRPLNLYISFQKIPLSSSAMTDCLMGLSAFPVCSLYILFYNMYPERFFVVIINPPATLCFLLLSVNPLFVLHKTVGMDHNEPFYSPAFQRLFCTLMKKWNCLSYFTGMLVGKIKLNRPLFIDSTASNGKLSTMYYYQEQSKVIENPKMNTTLLLGRNVYTFLSDYIFSSKYV